MSQTNYLRSAATVNTDHVQLSSDAIHFTAQTLKIRPFKTCVFSLQAHATFITRINLIYTLRLHPVSISFHDRPPNPSTYNPIPTSIIPQSQLPLYLHPRATPAQHSTISHHQSKASQEINTSILISSSPNPPGHCILFFPTYFSPFCSLLSYCVLLSLLIVKRGYINI